jgi:hypothetical protein
MATCGTKWKAMTLEEKLKLIRRMEENPPIPYVEQTKELKCQLLH